MSYEFSYERGRLPDAKWTQQAETVGFLEFPKSHENRARLVCRRPSTCYMSARNTLYYSSPFKRSKARDAFHVITARRRRNFGTCNG